MPDIRSQTCSDLLTSYEEHSINVEAGDGLNDKFEILWSRDSDSRKKWLEILADWPRSEPFAHPTYIEGFLTQHQRALCVVFSTDSGQVLFPLVSRELSSLEWNDTVMGLDLMTPYGYGGAFFWGEVNSDVFWSLFERWMQEENVVSLFARISLFPDTVLPFGGPSREVMDNIVRSLNMSSDEIWMDYDHKVRKNVKRALRSDVSIEWDLRGIRLDEFLSIYEGTMERREASSSYLFRKSFFTDLIDECPDNVAFAHAVKDGKVISTELILIGTDYAYSFLGGTDKDSYELRPNDLLKHEIINWCLIHGKKAFVLGGGIAPEDGIVKYKNAFAPHDGRVPFYVGEWIVDTAAYESLLSQKRLSDSMWEPKSGYFPAYRAPTAI